MTRIYKDQDAKIGIELVDNENKPISFSQLVSFKITAYTTSLESGVTFGVEDIKDAVLYMPSEKIGELDNGQLSLYFEIELEDERYPDGVYNKVLTVQTTYTILTKEKQCSCK